MSKKAIIISASSDIGDAMARRWMDNGWEVFGTYRTNSNKLKELVKRGARFVSCDLADVNSIKKACSELREFCSGWDVLVLCPGAQNPIGPFMEDNFDEWERSIKINLTSQLRVVHELLPERNSRSETGPCVLFFAGGGTNSAPENYSAYVLSKIGLIKMTELLDAEVTDTRFVIVGPGWVKTKIHDSTLKAGSQAGSNFQRTKDKLASNECTPMEKVLDCCDWVVKSLREVVSGRNFSVVFDAWGEEILDKRLKENSEMYKLRRSGNDFLVKEEG